MPTPPRARPASNRPVPVETPAGPTSAVSRADQELAGRALRKLANRQDLSRREREALKRYEKEKEERLRWTYYRGIPQKHWRAMSGRQTKVINEQAARYGLPFGGASVDLPAFVKAFHDFLAENALKLAKDDDPLLHGGAGNSPALERYRAERALLARLDRLEREGQLLPRDQVRESMGRVAAVLRAAGESLQRQFGPGAVEILHEALDDAGREIEHAFGDNAKEATADAPADHGQAQDG